ncbi:hypothetical protein N7501_004348 [Penicillium viridicatum]|nr:hypothetical protein N7501_004348 [Penicillium viridicatum]
MAEQLPADDGGDDQHGASVQLDPPILQTCYGIREEQCSFPRANAEVDPIWVCFQDRHEKNLPCQRYSPAKRRRPIHQIGRLPFLLWRYLNKRDARRDIPPGLLTPRWEVADKHAAKQHKKLEKMQKKKKWYATIQRPGHYLQRSCYN